MPAEPVSFPLSDKEEKKMETEYLKAVLRECMRGKKMCVFAELNCYSHKEPLGPTKIMYETKCSETKSLGFICSCSGAEDCPDFKPTPQWMFWKYLWRWVLWGVVAVAGII